MNGSGSLSPEARWDQDGRRSTCCFGQHHRVAANQSHQLWAVASHRVLQSCEHVWMDSPRSTFTCCMWEFTNYQFNIRFQIKIISHLCRGASVSLKSHIYVLPILVTTYQIKVLIINKSCNKHAIMRQWSLKILTDGQQSITDNECSTLCTFLLFLACGWFCPSCAFPSRSGNTRGLRERERGVLG